VKRLALKQGRLLVKHLVPAVIKPLHSLWNEVIGFLFFSLSILMGSAAVRSYLANEHGKVLLSGIFAIVMFCFGFSSFRRARKISRS
jgi:hypothetical protein